MKKKASLRTQKIVRAIYLLSLAEVLSKNLVMKKLDNLLVKNYFAMCNGEYNPPS